MNICAAEDARCGMRSGEGKGRWWRGGSFVDVVEPTQLAPVEPETTFSGHSGIVSLGRGSPGNVNRDQKMSVIRRHSLYWSFIERRLALTISRPLHMLSQVMNFWTLATTI